MYSNNLPEMYNKYTKLLTLPNNLRKELIHFNFYNDKRLDSLDGEWYRIINLAIPTIEIQVDENKKPIFGTMKQVFDEGVIKALTEINKMKESVCEELIDKAINELENVGRC